MSDQISSATLLVSKIYQDAAEQAIYENLAETLAARLQQTVIPFPIDQAQQSLKRISITPKRLQASYLL